MAAEEKIVIKQVNKPSKQDAKALTKWFCQVFGFTKDEIEPAMFTEIVTNNFTGQGTTSKTLNKKLSVPRSTVIYHLNRFIYAGLVIRKGRKYYLRSEDMESTIQELQSDMQREFNRMMEFAQMMDKMFEEDINARKRRKE